MHVVLHEAARVEAADDALQTITQSFAQVDTSEHTVAQLPDLLVYLLVFC